MDTYYWTTEEYHSDNKVTMSDYLDNHLDLKTEVICQDGTYAEIKNDKGLWAVHASGNGDSYNHKVEFEKL